MKLLAEYEARKNGGFFYRLVSVEDNGTRHILMPQWLTFSSLKIVREQAKLDGAELTDLGLTQWTDDRLSRPI